MNKRVGKMLQRELADIFLTHSLLFHSVLVTTTSVEVSSDFSRAKVYLSFVTISEYKQKEIILQKVIKQKKIIKKLLSSRVGSKMRHIPDLQFYIDHSVDNAIRIQRLLDSSNV